VRRSFPILVAAGLALALLSGACTAKPRRTSAGFEGTWARSGYIGNYRSTISILKEGERYRFRWKLDTEDGTWFVRCDWDGRCEETLDGKKVARYTFVVRPGATDSELEVECTRTPLDSEQGGYHYRDDLVLEPDGLHLTSYTRELNGRLYPRESTGVKRFEKIADGVADPPAGGRT
jgi:hypothetical protein